MPEHISDIYIESSDKFIVMEELYMRFVKMAAMFIVYIISAIEGCFGNLGVGNYSDPWEKWFGK